MHLILEKCPPLIAENSTIQCKFNEISGDCSKLMINGTRAIQSCYSTHRLMNRVDTSSNELHCLSNGKWNGQLLKCVPSNSIFLINYIKNI